MKNLNFAELTEIMEKIINEHTKLEEYRSNIEGRIENLNTNEEISNLKVSALNFIKNCKIEIENLEIWNFFQNFLNSLILTRLDDTIKSVQINASLVDSPLQKQSVLDPLLVFSSQIEIFLSFCKFFFFF